MNNDRMDTLNVFPKPTWAKYRNLRGFFIIIPSEPYREAFGSTNTLLKVEYSQGKIILTEAHP